MRGEAVRVRGLVKAWGETRAVDGIDFTADAGAFTVLLGPSGCGKSTTLRLVAGLEAASAGTIHIGDTEVTHLPPARRGLAMVFQSYALFPHMTVAENILFGLRVRRVDRATRKARLEKTAALLGLEGLLSRRPAQLSGGQKQRVALGRAIVAETPVCLMDEPLSNLDAKLRHEMRRELRGLQQALGITMLYVTHDQAEAMSMADRVIVLRDGRIEQDAPPAEVYDRPATAFVGRFIGTPPMNMVPLADGPAGATIRGDGQRVLARRGEGLLLGIRPEAIRLGGPAGLRATVGAVEYLGADSVLVCRIGSESLTARVPGRAGVAPGAAVTLSWSGADIHLFDAAQGHRRDEADTDKVASGTVRP